MTPNQWTSDLETFLGEDDYSKFLTKLHRCRPNQRLFWWMAKAWEKFIQHYPQHSAIDPLSTTPICHIHREEMGTEIQPILYGHFRVTHQRAIANHCPFGLPYISGPDWGGKTKEAEAFVCKTCRSIYERQYSSDDKS